MIEKESNMFLQWQDEKADLVRRMCYANPGVTLSEMDQQFRKECTHPLLGSIDMTDKYLVCRRCGATLPKQGGE